MGEQARLGRVRLSGWERTAYGLYRAKSAEALAAWELVLPPSGCFTHLTAAAEYGWWLPPLPGGLPVFAAQLASEPRPRRPGLKVLRSVAPPERRRPRRYLLASPVETLLACARDLGLLDLVVLIDAALHAGSTSLAELTSAATAGRAGAPALRAAVEYADHRSESPWETVLRLLHRACDIEVEPQRNLTTDDGVFLARADLWLVGTNAIHEYDGSTHLRVADQRRDLARLRRLGDEGVVRRGYTAADVMGHAHQILRDADLSLGRKHDPARLERWYSWLRESTFSDAGKARLLSRVGAKNGHGRQGQRP